VPGRYGTYTRAAIGFASNPHCPVVSPPSGETHTVIEFGLMDPVHGKGASVAVTMVLPETCTSSGGDSVYVHDGSDGGLALVEPAKARLTTAADETPRMAARHRIMFGYYKRACGIGP
jgi:hypothetical protein